MCGLSRGLTHGPKSAQNGATIRKLPKKYPVEHVAKSLAEGIVVGHKDMPEFLFEPSDIKAILAYISSLAG